MLRLETSRAFTSRLEPTGCTFAVPVPSPPRARRVLATTLFIALLGACRHSPTEPNPTTPPPIVLIGSLFADPISGGGNLLTSNVCACVSVPLAVVSTGRPTESLACNETHALGYPATYDGPVVVTVSAPTWSVTATYSVPIDPHVGLRVRADCRPQ